MFLVHFGYPLIIRTLPGRRGTEPPTEPPESVRVYNARGENIDRVKGPWINI